MRPVAVIWHKQYELLPLHQSRAGIIGTDTPRVDGVAKVTGQAAYAADEPVENVAHASLVTSSIARGRIRRIDCRAARCMPGVLDILTHKNVGKAVKGGRDILNLGYMATAFAPLGSSRIAFSGQIVAVAIAETLEASQETGEAIEIEYVRKDPTASFDDPGARETKPKSMGEPELSAGRFRKAFTRAAARIDAWYETPAQHHNPIELFQTTCAWSDDGHLTVWESSQNVRGYRFGLAQQLGISPKKIRFISTFVGGAFGSKGELGQATALIALAAKRIGRPVKLVASRSQGFTLRTFRAETRHHMQLASDSGGQLTALSHLSWELTSRTDRFALSGSDSTSRLYACPNVRTSVKNVQADRQTPGFMRAPPETPYLFPLESAMNELAYELNLDPLEMRRRNDTMIETVTGKPYTSRSLIRCIDTGANAFGWNNRDPRPGSMINGDELIGWGFASAFYPVMMGPASFRVTLTPDLKAVIEIGTHEIGTGVRTVIAQTVSDRLGVSVSNVDVRIGDSDLPAAPLSAGSSTTATVCSVVAKACEELRSQVGTSAATDRKSRLRGLDRSKLELKNEALWLDGFSEPLKVTIQRAGRGKPLVAETSNNAHGAPPLIGPALIRRGKALIDRRLARYVNPNLAEYHVPVNADVGDVTTFIVDEEDHVVNPLGIKGVGELGVTGMNAAVANAVFHATGIRCRKLPIRIENVLPALSQVNGR